MRLIDDAHVEAQWGALGAIDAGDGGTSEQRAVLAAVSGPRLTRTLVRDGTARALADDARFSGAARVSWAGPSLVEQ